MKIIFRQTVAMTKIRFLSSVPHRCLSTKALRAKRKAMISEIIRVDHAGEYGANRIYAGQHAVLGSTEAGPLIQHMWDQEKEHLSTFNDILYKTRTRPTALLPLWHVAGYALGAGAALLGGKEAAMACTVAVEETITDHYNAQIRKLLEDDQEVHKELLETISKFRDEEQEHHDIGLEQDAEKTPFYQFVTGAIKVGCKAAIWVSEKV